MIKFIKRHIKNIITRLFPTLLNSKNKENFDELQVFGSNNRLETPKKLIRKSSICIGNNVKIDSNCFIDARGGIMIGDNVVIEKNVVISSTNNSENNLEYKPVIIGNNCTVKTNSKIKLGTIIESQSDNDSLLNHKGNIIFVVSTGRSGSKAIAHLINQGNNSECLHDAFSHYNVWACDKLYKRVNEKEILNSIKSLYNAGKIAKKEIHAQSDQKLSAFIPELATIFPKAKFIWLIREAHSFVNSAYPRGWFYNSEFEYKENKNEFFLPNAIPSKMHATHRINGFKTGDFTEEQWKKATAFERNCWYWSYWNTLIEKDLNAINKERWIKIKLNKMNGETKNIAKFVGMIDYKVVTKKINEAYYKKITKSDWSKEMLKLYNKHCENNMKKWFEE